MSGFNFGTGASTAGGGFAFTAPASSVATTPLNLSTTGPASITGGGFSFGTAATTSSQPTGTLQSGFSLSAAKPATGLLPTPQSSSGLTLSGLLGGSTVSTTQSTPAPAFSFALGPTAATTATVNPLIATTSAATAGGFNFGGASSTPAVTTGQTSTAATVGAGFGSSLGSFSLPVATSAATAPSLTFGSQPTATAATTASTLLAGFGSSAASTSATVLSTATTTSSAAPASISSSGPCSVRQLEERLNKWLLEAKEQEERFLRQAQHVTAWDRVLQQGHGQVQALRTTLDTVKSDQNRLEAELDFIRGQQSELEQLLAPLESAVAEQSSAGLTHQGDRQRDNMYHLAQNLDGQLRQMSEDLVKVIEHVNNLNGTAEKQNDPVSLVAKILSAHMDTLKWVDQNALVLTQKVDEVAKNL